MQPSRWLLDHPQTSDEAARQARAAMVQSLWQPPVVLVVLVILAILLEVFLDAGRTLFVAGIAAAVALFFFLQAKAMVLRETYHRLAAEAR